MIYWIVWGLLFICVSATIYKSVFSETLNLVDRGVLNLISVSLSFLIVLPLFFSGNIWVQILGGVLFVGSMSSQLFVCCANCGFMYTAMGKPPNPPIIHDNVKSSKNRPSLYGPVIQAKCPGCGLPRRKLFRQGYRSEDR